ncbi:MAG: hypothetical protein JXO72_11485, partial [Vicinamibacteria bacterium]|nr:hypothetical protein [Vicinamibacteria bacterium]
GIAPDACQLGRLHACGQVDQKVSLVAFVKWDKRGVLLSALMVFMVLVVASVHGYLPWPRLHDDQQGRQSSQEAMSQDLTPIRSIWGELSASKERASAWADRLVGIARKALSHDPKLRGRFHGTSVCLSVLYGAGRYGEIVDFVASDRIKEMVASEGTGGFVSQVRALDLGL